MCPSAAGAGVAIGVEQEGAEHAGAQACDMPHRLRQPACAESAVPRLRVAATKPIVKSLNMIIVLFRLNVGSRGDGW